MTSMEATGPYVALVGRLQASATREAVTSFASELGHLFAELPPESEQARGLRLDLLKAARKHDSESALVLSAFATFLVAYEASRESVEHEADAAADLDDVEWTVLRRLSVQPATPSELAGGKDNGFMSRRLTQLERRGLIVPRASQDGRARPRELTTLGHLVVQRAAPAQQASHELAEPESLELTTNAPPSPSDSWMSRCVESTLRALKSVLVSSDRVPMHRREVEACFAPELRKHGFMAAFEYHVEAFGLADKDDDECFWSTSSNRHALRWTQLMAQLRDSTLCQQVFAAQPNEAYTLVTVSERLDQWRQILSVLTQRIDVHTVESLNHVTQADCSDQVTSLIVDDTTLARRVAQHYSSKLFTLECKPGLLVPELRRLNPTLAPAHA